MLYGLSDMSQSDGIYNLSETWLNAVDRGGLTHINHTAFKMFHAVEMELRHHLTIANVQDMDQKFKDRVVSSIIADVDVQYYMECATEDLDEDERKELLLRIVNSYITVHGFSFTKSWLEMYKWDENKKLQKSKSL